MSRDLLDSLMTYSNAVTEATELDVQESSSVKLPAGIDRIYLTTPRQTKEQLQLELGCQLEPYQTAKSYGPPLVGYSTGWQLRHRSRILVVGLDREVWYVGEVTLDQRSSEIACPCNYCLLGLGCADCMGCVRGRYAIYPRDLTGNRYYYRLQLAIRAYQTPLLGLTSLVVLGLAWWLYKLVQAWW